MAKSPQVFTSVCSDKPHKSSNENETIFMKTTNHYTVKILPSNTASDQIIKFISFRDPRYSIVIKEFEVCSTILQNCLGVEKQIWNIKLSPGMKTFDVQFSIHDTVSLEYTFTEIKWDLYCIHKWKTAFINWV